jgi:hypothetical protein
MVAFLGLGGIKSKVYNSNVKIHDTYLILYDLVGEVTATPYPGIA